MTLADKLPKPRMMMLNGLLIPRRVTIETIYDCNFRCTMCPWSEAESNPSTLGRKKGPMDQALFKSIIDRLVPYSEHIEMMDLFSLGEPLMDRRICERILYAKSRGFKNLAFATNASLLIPRIQQQLLETGIETILFSIDGATKESYEKIRVRGNFEKVVENCLGMIERRNTGDYPTRFVVRFVRQKDNWDEWPMFREFWSTKLNASRRDLIGRYDVHTWGGSMRGKDDTLAHENSVLTRRDESIERAPCFLISEILNILADGRVPICHEDWHLAKFNMGNVQNADPVEVFNAQHYWNFRRIHAAGKKNSIPMCAGCTVHYSDATKEYVLP
ncbi:SPASM domain-containing protein [Candidatus Giovannonibacteria bacterium]|nr:SPASM domain-containing protein [Candidatus Giovannonibacteria bacterium]